MNGTHFRELPDASRNEERRTCHARAGTDDGKFITPDHASDRGSIAIADKVGLLARNTFFAALPIPSPEQWAMLGKTYALLTVARQLVIYTRFPVTSRYAKPYPVDEAIQGKQSVADFEGLLMAHCAWAVHGGISAPASYCHVAGRRVWNGRQAQEHSPERSAAGLPPDLRWQARSRAH